MSPRRIVGFVAGAMVLAVVLGAATIAWRSNHPAGPSESQVDRGQARPSVGQTTDRAHASSLYCDFYSFTHNTIVVSFDFAVDAASSSRPRYSERYVVEPDGTKTSYDGADQVKPIWAFSVDDGTPIITSTDGETQIRLYGLKQDDPGVSWIEAGVRNNAYKNLEGKCRQAYFAGSTRPPNPNPRP